MTNYNEDESDGFSEEVEDYSYSTTVPAAYETDIAGIDLILDYKPKDDAGALKIFNSLFISVTVLTCNRYQRTISVEE